MLCEMKLIFAFCVLKLIVHPQNLYSVSIGCHHPTLPSCHCYDHSRMYPALAVSCSQWKIHMCLLCGTSRLSLQSLPQITFSYSFQCPLQENCKPTAHFPSHLLSLWLGSLTVTVSAVGYKCVTQHGRCLAWKRALCSVRMTILQSSRIRNHLLTM